MGSVRLISSIAASLTLAALFGRRGRTGEHGEVEGPMPSPPPPGEEPHELLVPGPEEGAEQQHDHPGAPTSEGVEAERGARTGGVRPVPHPIRPWELWHPADEPARLFRHDPEERVTWQEIADEDESPDVRSATDVVGAIDLGTASTEDVWAEHDAAISSDGPDDIGTLLDPDTPDASDRPDEEAGEHFGFGRLRPFTRSVVDDPHAALGFRSATEGAADASGPSEADVSGGVRFEDGDVLFRELVSPDRMTASEHALEDQRGPGSASVLINGPVTRRSDRDHGRGRRRLSTGLRAVGGDGDPPDGA